MRQHRIILADKFMDALHEGGLLPDPRVERIASVTITAKAGEPVILEYVTFGDERLLRVANEAEEVVEIPVG